MGEADQEVFMNRNKNARLNELGNYFGALPKRVSVSSMMSSVVISGWVFWLSQRVAAA
jgi:hypothetical protein